MKGVTAKEVWENNLPLFPETKLDYPHENLVRIFSGRYVAIPQPPARIMEHGFGTGNVIKMLAQKGYQCYGCELSQTLIDVVGNDLKENGLSGELRVVDSEILPFDDNMFEIIISWNVLHYCTSRQKAAKQVNELYRMLKPGGILLLSTLHPFQSYIRRCRPLGDGVFQYVEDSPNDNFLGVKIFCVENQNELRALFPQFSSLLIGMEAFDLFLPKRAQWRYLVYAVKQINTRGEGMKCDCGYQFEQGQLGWCPNCGNCRVMWPAHGRNRHARIIRKKQIDAGPPFVSNETVVVREQSKRYGAIARYRLK